MAKYKSDILFNGNYISNNNEFDQYLKRFGYNLKMKIKKLLVMQFLKIKKFSYNGYWIKSKYKISSNYQAGALSFEIISNGKKLISNSGYFQKVNHQLNELSKSSAVQSTLIVDDNLLVVLKSRDKKSKINQGLRILKKKIVFEKNYWKINASHDGYLKQYGIIHDREIEFYPEQIKFIGHDKIISKKILKI